MNVPIPVLLYHCVSEDATPQFRKWAIRPATFAAHMAYLSAQHYTPIIVSRFAQSIADRKVHLPDRPVVISFDDGCADFYTEALPALQRYDFVATLYIVTKFVGQTSRWLYREGEGDRPMLTWAQIAELGAVGIECGAHSHSHPQLDTLSTASAKDEIVRSKSELEQHLGRAVETFAYPHGYSSPAVRRIVQQAGYSSACGVKHAMSALTDDRFSLARIIVSADTDVAGLARLLAGEGLSIAPRRERVQTIGWRVLRRSISQIKRSTHV